LRAISLDDRLEVSDHRDPAFLLALPDVGGYPDPAGAAEVAALHPAQLLAAQTGADREEDQPPLPLTAGGCEQRKCLVTGESVPLRPSTTRPFGLPGRVARPHSLLDHPLVEADEERPVLGASVRWVQCASVRFTSSRFV
jgi:hypothetical protein